MNRGVLAVSVFAGLASAALLGMTSAALQPPVMGAPSVAPQPSAESASAPAVPVSEKLANASRPVVANKAPVPLQVASRAPVALPPSKDSSQDQAKDQANDGKDTEGKDPAKENNQDNAADDPSRDPTSAIAKAAIEADGYKGVRIVSKVADGVWRARALRGRTEIGVTVDGRGNVSAD